MRAWARPRSPPWSMPTGFAGMRVIQNRTVPFLNFSQPTFGQERFVGSNISIAVDPNNSATVYIAWADQEGGQYTLHVRRSVDRGATWTPNDLRTIANATNPALAVNEQRHGRVSLPASRPERR